MFTLLILALIVVVALIYFRRVHDPVRRGRLVRRAGMMIMGLFAAIFCPWVSAELVMDPGGWQAVGSIALLMVPLIAVCAVAWFKPTWGFTILVALTAVAVGVGLWRALDEGVRDLEDRIGPVTTIGMIAVAFGAAALAHTRARPAGIMLLVIGLLPVLFGALADGGGNAIDTARFLLGSPLILAGVLFLVSDALGGARQSQGGSGRPLPNVT